MGKFKTGLGGQLLSEASKAVPQNPFSIRHIPIEQIHENEKNEFSMEEIEELKQSIKEVGLQQNLVVMPEGDGYVLLTGHRRFRAIHALLQDGFTQWEAVPCIIKELSRVDLNISDKAKECYLIATTNVEQRKMTPADCNQAMKMLDLVYDELQAIGESVGKRRDFMAQRLGISPRSVQNLMMIDKNLSEEIKPALVSTQLPLRVATQMAKLPEEAQKELWQSRGASASEQEVKAYTEKKNKEAAIETVKQYDRTIVGRDDFDTIRQRAYFPGVDFKKTILNAAEMQRLKKEKEKVLAAIDKIEEILKKAAQRY